MRKAKHEDIMSIVAILDPIVKEMNATGNYQWDHKYPKAKDFEKDIECGTLYVYEDSGVIGGFICIDSNEPQEYRSARWSQNNEAMIIHRMAVNVSSRGQGIAKKMMYFAEQIALANGIHYLKTDTFSGNENMNALFRRVGFRKVGDINLQGKEGLFSCYEKQVDL